MNSNNPHLKNGIIIILIILCINITFICHFILKIEIIYSHFFYLPIILSGLWWNRKGILTAVFLSMIYLIFHLISPISDTDPYPIDVILRACMFCIVGFVIGVVSERRLRAENRIMEITKELKIAYDSLKKIDKTKSTFISIAAHELRTPLQPIRIYADLMLRDKFGKFTTEEKKKLNYFINGVQRFVQIISQLLDLSALEKGKFKLYITNVNFQNLIDRVIKDMKPLSEQKNISITSEVPSIDIKCDPLAIEQVLENLISNAIKYNYENGKIKITSTIENDIIHVKVKDTGIGIDKNDQTRIFERFYIIDNKYSRNSERLGIGLFIVKSIIELHDGKVWVESKKGKGSVFHFTLKNKS